MILLFWAALAYTLKLNKTRVIYALVFAVLGTCHFIAVDAINDASYFMLSASFDLAAIVLLSLIKRDNALRLDLCILSMASVLTNGVGAILFLSNMEAMSYNLLSGLIILMQLARLLAVWDGRDDNHTTDSTDSRVVYSGFSGWF